MNASAGYNCGADYMDAISNCDLPCPSKLGFTIGAAVNECPEHKPYCYKAENCPDAAPAEAATNEGDAVTEGETIDPELTDEMQEKDVAINSMEINDEPEMLEASEEGALPERVAEEESAPEIMEMVANSEPAGPPPTISPAPTTEYDKRRNIPNPGNHFCAIGWSEATIECETNVDAIPCPPDENGVYMSCPEGTYCYGVSNCVRATPSTDAPTHTPTTYAPTTESPSSSPISAEDLVNFYFCGSDLADANENCGRWCRYGTDAECPEGQTCQLESTCNATALNFTIDWDLMESQSESPSATPTTYAPTLDDNPENLYCSETWLPSTFDGPCGTPCPNRSECPNGQYCYQSLTCKRQKLVKMKWCGKDMDDMVDRCGTDDAKECKGGTDEECGDGEKCFLSDACLKKQELAESEGMLWCGRSYKHLVENCPKQCPGGTNDECGQDENGKDMICFNMKDENVTCAEEGVGIKEPVDPDMLWCGNDWTHLVENCPKKCPEGSDEECGFMGTTCYDMTGSDLLCKTEGFGVKEKGDPLKRFCGTSFAQMHAECPKRCPSGSGDECPDGMNCYEDSLCEIEGQGVEGMEIKDPAGMFCVNELTQASTCVPCPTGGGECGDGEACWSDMEWACQGDVTQTTETETETAVDVSVEFEEPEEEKEEAVEEEEPAADEPESEPDDVSVEFDESDAEADEPETVPASQTEPAAEPASEPAVSEPAPSESAASEPVPAESSASEPAPAESTASEPAPAEPSASEPAPASEPAALEPAPVSQPEPVVASSVSDEPMMKVENLRMALFGMETLTSDHVDAWEEHTGNFVEEFYNTGVTSDAIRDSVHSVVSSFESVEFGMSSGRRNLRVQRNLASAFLITYHQKIQFESSSDVQVEDVVQHPFSTSTFREQYVSYLKLREPVLFAELSEVSAVFLPVKMSDPVVVAEASAVVSSSESNESTTDSIVESGKFKDFQCHTSGAPCLTGKCPDGDHCMFFATTSTNIESYYAPGQLPTEDAATSILGSVLNGESSAVATDSANSAFGPSDVNGKMLLTGVNLVNSEHLMEWSYQTAMYVQDFFNNESNSADYVQDQVYNVQARFEIVSVDYGTTSDPSTQIAFIQTIEWDSLDESIDVMTVVNQPFMTEAYRQAYVEHLQNYLPGTFKLVTEVPSVDADAEPAATSDYKFSDTFFCGIEYPVDCGNTQHCTNADDCPAGHGCFVAEQCLATSTSVIAESTLPCNLCKPGQIGADAEIIFNEKPSRCAEAYDHMVLNYNEGSPTCLAAQDALSSTCCRDPPSSEPAPAVESIAIAETTTTTTTEAIATNTTATTEAIAQTVETDEPELEYPSNTYFCGTNFQDASTTCSKPCPSGMDNECLGLGETCHGNTECGLRESFFCGTSWFDASDKCSKPCPDGDSSVCGEGEQCFAWTSCANTDSFYCGYSFENASQECKIPCKSRSSMDCPDDMGCWAYTTCEATREGAHESGPEPMNDFFCGDTKEAASSTCSIACQSGKDDECPGDLKCFDGTGCSEREHFWCGSNWFNAAQTCGQPCSSGSSDECGDGESCYAHTECQSDLFFCGESFEHASETCGKACPSRSSNECDNGQSCYAFVTACAKSDAAQSMAESYTFMAANNAWGLDKNSFAKDDSEQDLLKADQLPEWYVTWEGEQMNATPRKPSYLISFVCLALAGVSTLLAL